MRRPALLAVDGGGSKIDATLLRRDGTVLGAERVAAGDYEQTGDDAFLDPIDEAIRGAVADAGIATMPHPVADLGVFCLAGADLPVDDRRIGRGLARRGWVGEHVLRNDTFAVLRAGTDRTWGVGIVCGFGTNCSGVSPKGRVFRLPAIGPVSGDWGGGGDLGATALYHAIRAADGRGGPNRAPTQRARALRHAHPPPGDGGALRRATLRRAPRELAPLVFAEAAAGDVIARARRQAGGRDRGHGHRRDPQARDARARPRRGARRRHLPQRVEPVPGAHHSGVHAVAPAARIVRLTAPPVVGAAMLGLDLLGSGRAAHARTRASLTHRRLDPHTRGRKER